MRSRPNEMLASLSVAEFEELRPHLTTIDLARGDVLVEAGNLARRVYFPHSGVVSLFVRLSDGHMIETGMVGKESLVGGPAGLHAAIAPYTAVVQVAGIGSVLDAAHLKRLADASASMRAILARHEVCILLQAQQAAACHAVHPLQARFATWILRYRDLAGADRLDFTQEYVATMLGVRRTTVTLIATGLQETGLISYRRGHLQVQNAERLRTICCECYERLKQQQKRLLADTSADMNFPSISNTEPMKWIVDTGAARSLG